MKVDWNELIPHIAHDGRALIRKSLSNAQLLERKLGPLVDEEARGHFRAVYEGQGSLNEFLTRLVALSEAAQPPLRKELVDLGAAVLGAKLKSRDAINQRSAELSIGEIPECNVSRRIQLVLQELLSNSLQYWEPARPLQISINAERKEDKIYVRVQDNGSGWDPEMEPKLFQPLQILDAKRGGFGLGLAICRAIVENAGGEISAVHENPGACLMFELPLA